MAEPSASSDSTVDSQSVPVSESDSQQSSVPTSDVSASSAPGPSSSSSTVSNASSANTTAVRSPQGSSGRSGTARFAITATLFRRRPPVQPTGAAGNGDNNENAQQQTNAPNNANNNQNRRPGGLGGGVQQGTMRDRLFYALFVRMTLTYARIVPPPLRRLIEFMILVKALTFLFVLSYIHYTLTITPASCLNHVKNSWPREGVLRVLITRNLQPMVIPDPNYDPYENNMGRAIFATWPGDNVTHYDVKQKSIIVEKGMFVLNEKGRIVERKVFIGPHHDFFWSYERHGGHLYEYVPETEHVHDDQSSPGPPAFDPPATNDDLINGTSASIPIQVTDDVAERSYETVDLRPWPEELRPSPDPELPPTDQATSLPGAGEEQVPEKRGYEMDDAYEEHDIPHDEQLYDYAVEYSLEYGFLRLSTKTRERLQLPVMTVVLNPDSDACFGDDLSKFILSEMLGYEDVLMSSVKLLAEGETHKGYLRDLMTGEHYRFIDVGSTRLFYIAAFLIMIVFTFGISMLLRFSHHQIFLFIVDLLQLFEMNQAVALPAAPLLTVILALVGMEAIMSEFFNETSTAFYVIMMVWVADQYDAICCHSAISRRYWLRFFYLYQFAFYAYTYRFNGNYNGLALLSSWLFIQHSMVYFFHHYEIPLILHEHRVQRLLQGLHDGTFDSVVNINNNNNTNTPNNNNNNSNAPVRQTQSSTAVLNNPSTATTTASSATSNEPVTTTSSLPIATTTLTSSTTETLSYPASLADPVAPTTSADPSSVTTTDSNLNLTPKPSDAQKVFTNGSVANSEHDNIRADATAPASSSKVSTTSPLGTSVDDELD